MDVPEKWRLFLGDNPAEIEPPRFPPAGLAKLARHLGKPLSDDLWDDVLRLRVRTMRVCTPDDVGEDGKTPEHLWHQLILFLDAEGEVVDFWLCGIKPPRKAGVTFEDG